MQRPTPQVAVLLIIAIWAFCRFYYCAFYVIERYLDPNLPVHGTVGVCPALHATKQHPRNALKREP
jgi:hypothetical protein